jgi:hypothetical protein
MAVNFELERFMPEIEKDIVQKCTLLFKIFLKYFSLYVPGYVKKNRNISAEYI